MNLYTKGKYLLLDLDGTLTDTADISLKPMKDGLVQTDLSQIRIFKGAIEFLSKARELSFECIIISDSHPRYVDPIWRSYFGEYCSTALPLAEKPNTLKTLRFLQEKNIDISQGSCYVIGDSWLDVELGRGLGATTILTDFYKAENLEIRDGIGDYVKNIKSGSTYYAKKYCEILDILQNPLQKLLCVEAKFQGAMSCTARRLRPDRREGGQLIAHRVLARQSQGECDKYHATEKYFEFNRLDRSIELLYSIRDAVTTYIHSVLNVKSYSWNILTYVPDKRTTQPRNKMGELFGLIAEQIKQKAWSIDCFNIFEWDEEVDSSTRQQSTASDRRNFVGSYLALSDRVNVTGKSVIVLDDQYTTGATADVIVDKLRNKGIKNILFIALFHLITPVNSSKLCPICQIHGVTKQLQIWSS